MGRAQMPQFFKFLLAGSRASIPPAFLGHIVDDNHGKAIVSFAGKFWHIKVQESKEGLFFTDGWLELTEAGGLSEGCLLVFRYEGNMLFTMKVFDHSGCRNYNFLDTTMGATRKPQFFKVLLGGSRVSIPPAFVGHIVDDNHGKATVFSAGEFWHIKVEESEEGLFFTDGWQALINAHRLSEGCLIVLCYEGNMVFTLKVFDHSACRVYEFFINGKLSKRRKADIEEDSNRHSLSGIKLEKVTSCTENKIQCQKKINQTNLVHCRIGIPLSFCASAGLKSSQQVIIRDPDRRLWCVFFSYSPQTPRLGKGWSEFSQHHKLEVGDSCIFTHVSKHDKLIDVEIKRRSRESLVFNDA